MTLNFIFGFSEFKANNTLITKKFTLRIKRSAKILVYIDLNA